MSFGYASKRNTQSKRVFGNTALSTPWVRNPSWTALPSVTSADNKFVGLHRVDLDSNFLALSAAGNYTVDWGDGSATENILTPAVAQHQYTYTDAGLVNTNAPVTLTDTGDLVTRTAHGYSNGYTVSFYNISNTTGLTEGQVYYVVSATADTFQVSATQGGSAVALTTDGTATLLPYKLAIVTVTPQAGQTFTTINLHKKHTQTGLSAHSSGFLDIVIAGSSLTSILISSISAGSGTQNINFRGLQQVSILSSAVASASYLFYNCSNLQSVVAFSSSALTNTSHMFDSCDSLTTVSLFNTALVTTMANMFEACYSLTTVPLFNTVGVVTTGMANMFLNCYSLTTVPLFNTVNVTSMANMFQNCYSLTTVPLFNTALVTSMSVMFQNCYSLTTVPLFNTANVTTMSSMFIGCSALTTVPLFDTLTVTTMGNMFESCYSLTTVPLFNTVGVVTTGMTSMFNNCYSLTTVPLFNTANVTGMSAMFQNCYSLTTVPLFNTANVTTMSSMFNTCLSLTTVPLFNTIKVTTMSGMFTGCRSLTTVPLFNTVAVITMTGMFSDCEALVAIPQFNVASTTSLGSTMVSSNPSLSKATLSGARFAISYSGCKLSETELTSIMDNLGTSNTQGLVLTISSNWGAGATFGVVGTPTAGSTTITTASTTGVTAGMQWTGVGSPATTPIACSFTTSTNLVGVTGHGLSNGDEVSFATIVTTTGISSNKIYLVVSANPNDFQVALTSGGAAVALTTNGTGTVRWRSVVTVVAANASITVSRPATATGSFVLTFRTLKTQTASLKGWGVSG